MNEIFRYILLGYFISHIPITLIVDFQVILGQYYPPILQQVFTFYIDTYHDHISATQPWWFKSFVWAEALFQLPFFFVATYGLLYKKNWIRIPSIVYGIHVATTVWPILAETIFSTLNTFDEKKVLIGFYAPYFIIPLLLALTMCFEEKPFGTKSKSA